MVTISDGWKRTVDAAKTDSRWDDYDVLLQSEVTDYNTRFAATPGYAAVNWLLCRAMLWNESGGPDNRAWKGRVMQIGHPLDPAYGVVRNGRENSDLIVSDAFATLLSKDDNIDKPEVNVRAGLAYLFTRMAFFDIKSVERDPARKAQTYTVAKGDSFEKIARKVHTTTDNLKSYNKIKPTSLRAGMKLTYRPAFMQRFISGWRMFQTAVIAKQYNGDGDPDYSAKLNYLLQEVFPKIKR